jgi:hypothetical protein
MNHIFGSDGMKDHFNGQIENREMPGRVSMEEQVRCLESRWKLQRRSRGPIEEVWREEKQYTLPIAVLEGNHFYHRWFNVC